MYPVLNEIMEKRGVTIADIAKLIGVTEAEATAKLNESTENDYLTVKEADKIRCVLFPEYSLDYLYRPGKATN